MKKNEVERLTTNLVNKYGLPIKASVDSGSNGQHIILEPIDVHANEGFQVRIQIGWRSLHINFIPGRFASDLLNQMCNSSIEKKILFTRVAEQILNEKGGLIFKINEVEIDPLHYHNWPTEWKTFSFSLRKTPLEINTDDHALTEELINLWIERFFGCIIALSPLEEIEEFDVTGLPEGAASKVIVNRYERNRYNRTICINFLGSNCTVCDIDFGKVYGSLGNGFIHVHHITPVSQLREGYVINPIKDLVPVCPNCHAMLHKKTIPYTVEELKEIMNSLR